MKLRVISHTHWDREWFLPATFTQEWLPEFFDSLIRLLETDPEYRFILDGQTILIEDALKAPGIRPDLRARIHRFTREGRLVLGPYYLQPDWNLVSPESLIRNIEIGRADARRLGGYQRCGWLMDNFGQISQCPQIHASFGLNAVFMWRGLNLPPESVRTEYDWLSADGSGVTAIYLLDSYRNAMRLLANPGAEQADAVRQRVESIADRIRPFSPTGLGVLMNGYDQEMEPEAINPILRTLREQGFDIRQTTPEEFLEELSPTLKTGHAPPPPKVFGEQFNGQYICVFPGVLSTRTYLKRMNYLAETEMECYLEPLLVTAALTGFRWPVARLDELQRRILRNHPHDTICGVSVDDVHTDMEERLKRIRETQGALEREALDVVGLRDPDHAVVFNPLPYPRTVVVDDVGGGAAPPVLVREVPGLGWKTFRTGRGDDTRNPVDTIRPVMVDQANWTISNGLVTVTANEDGTISMTSPGGTRYTRLLELEDQGDTGDTYSWAPVPEPDTGDAVRHTVRPETVSLRIRDESPLRATLIMELTLRLPEALNADRSTRSDTLRMVPLVHEIRIDTGSSVALVTTTVRNTVRDHRLRVRFPVPPEMNRIRAGVPMDTVGRAANPEVYEETRFGPQLRRLMLGAREPDPITTLPIRDFVSCTDDSGAKGLAVCTPGLFEYEYSSGFLVTLLRAVGWLARPDLTTRTGDAGPLIATADAQCLRDLTVQFGLYPFDNERDAARVPAVASEVRAPARVWAGYRRRPRPGDNGADGLLHLTSTDDRAILSAVLIKDVEVLVRLYNPSDTLTTAEIRWNGAISSVNGCDLAGNPGESLPLKPGGGFTLDLPPHTIRTCAVHGAVHPASAVHPETSAPSEDAASRTASPDTYAVRSLDTELHIRTVPLPPAVDERFLRTEIDRSRELERALDRTRHDLESATTKIAHLRARSAASTAHRTLLEAQISVIMTERKLEQIKAGRDRPYPYSESTRSNLRRIGRELNEARIRKRTDDYLLAIAEGGLD